MDASKPEGKTDSSEATAKERRTNLALRRLIDEMLGRVRELSTNAAWTPEERSQAERELDAIMQHIRRETHDAGAKAK